MTVKSAIPLIVGNRHSERIAHGETIEYELDALKLELLAYYLTSFSSPLSYYTLAVLPTEVDIIKRLIVLVGGRETCEVMVHCWNTARQGYPAILPATSLDFMTTRPHWDRRG